MKTLIKYTNKDEFAQTRDLIEAFLNEGIEIKPERINGATSQLCLDLLMNDELIYDIGRGIGGYYNTNCIYIYDKSDAPQFVPERIWSIGANTCNFDHTFFEFYSLGDKRIGIMRTVDMY